jgi:hypothetical protein
MSGVPKQVSEKFASYCLIAGRKEPISFAPGESILFNRDDTESSGVARQEGGSFLVKKAGNYFVCYGLQYSLAEESLPAAIALSVDGFVRSGAILAMGRSFSPQGWMARQAVLSFSGGSKARLFNAGEKPLDCAGSGELRAYLTFLRL